MKRFEWKFLACFAAIMAVMVLIVTFTAPMHTSPVTPVATTVIGQPPVAVEVLDQSLAQFVPMWQREIGRRFTNAVAILVHGGDFVEGQWVVGASIADRRVMPAADVVKHYQKLYPTRTVILLACNPGHLKLGVPGVYYAHSSVWCVPDRELTPDMFQSGDAMRTLQDNRWVQDPEVVGNIFEFQAD